MAHGDMKFAARDTFLISPYGKIVKVWEKVDPNTHSADVLAELEANQRNKSHSSRRKKARALN